MDACRTSRQTVRCAIYTRQSIVRPGDDLTLASCAIQREECLDFVRGRDRHGRRALDDDEGYSGANVEWPAFERLVDFIAERGVDRIVVYRIDRLTRSLSDWARIRAMLERRTVTLSVVAGSPETDGGALARMQLNTPIVFAELEREMIGERLANARAVKRAHGRGSPAVSRSASVSTNCLCDVNGAGMTPPLAHGGHVTAVAWSPDGRRLATACANGTALVWDPKRGEAVTPPLTHRGRVSRLVWSPDGVLLATASDDGTARVWDAASGQPVTLPLVHRVFLTAVAWSPDGRRLATASADKTARVWDVWDAGTLVDLLIAP